MKLNNEIDLLKGYLLFVKSSFISLIRDDNKVRRCGVTGVSTISSSSGVSIRTLFSPECGEIEEDNTFLTNK